MDDLRVISGIIHVLKRGLQWRDAPSEYGPHIERYKADLEALGADFKTEKTQPILDQISKEATLQLLRENDNSNGIVVGVIVGLYQKMGINTSWSRCVQARRGID